MSTADDPKPPKPEDNSSEGVGADKSRGQGAGDPERDGKPDEGIRPDQLTSENDGGVEG